MSTQLNIFSGLRCSHCQKDPGTKPTNVDLWDGFKDQDTGELVCRSCKTNHYKKKAVRLMLKKQIGMTYSEFPVSLLHSNSIQ